VKVQQSSPLVVCKRREKLLNAAHKAPAVGLDFGTYNTTHCSISNLEKRTKEIAYADDLLITVKVGTVREAENYANIEISKITKWAKDNSITFNEQKPKTVVVTRKKRRDNEEISIYLNNNPLEEVNNIKYMGIFLDSKLNFREHFMHITGKCNKLIHALAKSAKLGWELAHEALHTIYKGAILPLMLYGAPIWIGARVRNATKFYIAEFNGS